ncbi:MAG: NAD-glutamate dehydrogenase [Candidatus Paracaedibacteraceae bacterium]|nr:NAD-glutamate dehydrogenase [Candidatus Paracaedibacteraceae bacterium]
MDLIEKIKANCLVKLSQLKTDASLVNESSLKIFIDKFYNHIDIDMLKQYHNCYGDVFFETLVIQAWESLQKRLSKQPFLCVTDASNFSSSVLSKNSLIFITLVYEDYPFLIDSLLALFKSIKLHVRLISHPVFCLARDKTGQLKAIYSEKNSLEGNKHFESVITFVLQKDENLFENDQLKSMLSECCFHVQSVVDDFPTCRDALYFIGMQCISLGKYFGCDENRNDSVSFSEAGDFLKWLTKDHFVFLGARYFNIDSINKNASASISFKKSACELFPENGVGLFRHPLFHNEIDLNPVERCSLKTSSNSFHDKIACGLSILVNDMSLPFLSILKSSIRSTVHKNARIECIEILNLNENGEICGIYQFVGIFTRQFFKVSPFYIPVLRNRVQRAFDRFDTNPVGYSGKILTAILSTIPNDQLFHFNEDSLHMLCEKVLYRKQRCALNIKIDSLGQFATVLIFLPCEKYSQESKVLIRKYLEKELNGVLQSEHSLIAEQEFARMLLIINCNSSDFYTFDIQKMEEDINAFLQTWEERFQSELMDSSDIKTFDAKGIFCDVYQSIFSPTVGVRDFKFALSLTDKMTAGVDTVLNIDSNTFTFQVFTQNTRAYLYDLMPIFQNLGLTVLSEFDFKLMINGKSIYLHNFECAMHNLFNEDDAKRLREGFSAIWNGDVENDRLNVLLSQSKLTIRQITILRALVRAINQMQFLLSIDYVSTISSMYPALIEGLINYFEVRFDPTIEYGREEHLAVREVELQQKFYIIKRSDHDLIMRHILSVIKACVRTNSFQNKQYLSFKFKSDLIPDLPKPVPLYEIFVYSPFMEGVHLRTGKVARGGIRWSDRFEDFRQEVLNLAKTQLVKNSIIIPVGAKGGFVSRRYELMLQKGVAKDLLKKEVIDCYKTFIRGLLDLTDNQKDGVFIAPPFVVRHDDNDPYLVVAADKGTASFSDTANAISKEYNFWLDDAFASGGSFGYDHKKMAITSRGAWISVQNHFQSLGLDINMPFTVVGVGDMAGDIFGNGMLQSKNICLVAAFNHQHIFLDPTPDKLASFQERKRLFELETSTWDDYNKAHVSTGGGIFSRNSKSIALSPEIKVILDIPDHITELSPDLLIQYILKAKVDLLWFGGIGTYVRATSEIDLDVRDPQNDSLRIEAIQLRCRIIGEGANLAMTQKSRIEYALLNGRLNTDAIDNSAGVSCSDHEVNIKILFSHLMQEKKITRDARDELLSRMTEDIAGLVLNDNRDQNHVLNWLVEHSKDDLKAYKGLIETLESNPFYEFNRKHECLPDNKEIDQRFHEKKGLTRPELSVILAFSKIILFQRFLESAPINLEQYTHLLLAYFPSVLHHKFANAIKHHSLSKEIIATTLSNQLINHFGPIDVFELAELNNNDLWKMADGYFFVTALFGEKLKQLANETSNYNVIVVMRQLLMVYFRHQNIIKQAFDCEYDSLVATKNWFIGVPYTALPEFFELICQNIMNDKEYKSKDLYTIYQRLDRVLSFKYFLQLSKDLHLEEPWQRQAKAYLLDEWVCLQVKLVLFAHESNKGAEWLETIEKKQDVFIFSKNNSNPIYLFLHVQNSAIKNDLVFFQYYINYFKNYIKSI